MGDKSKIEWTDATWNPIRARNRATGKVGHYCVHVSEGCRNCYAERLQPRFGNRVRYAAQDREQVELFLDEDVLRQPLRWKRPRMIFVCSMTDLFGEFVPDEWIDKIFAVMAIARQHTFQVLTKRAFRLMSHFEDVDDRAQRIGVELGNMLDGSWIWSEGKPHRSTIEGLISLSHGMAPDDEHLATKHLLPLPNVWLGTSVEDQATAEERIPHLLNAPAAVRFLSAEPLLGPLTLDDICDGWKFIDALRGEWWHDQPGSDGQQHTSSGNPKLDWVIVGGESGPKARPMHPDWARSLRDQCAGAGVPFFFKQWGEWAEGSNFESGALTVLRDGRFCEAGAAALVAMDRQKPVSRENPVLMHRAGKARAGRLLDGVTHDAMPVDGTGEGSGSANRNGDSQ